MPISTSHDRAMEPEMKGLSGFRTPRLILFNFPVHVWGEPCGTYQTTRRCLQEDNMIEVNSGTLALAAAEALEASWLAGPD